MGTLTTTVVGEISTIIIIFTITTEVTTVAVGIVMALITTIGIVMDVIITEITIMLVTTNPKEVKGVKMEVIMIIITTTPRKVKEVKEVREVKGGTMMVAAITPREVKVDTNILVTIHEEDIC